MKNKHFILLFLLLLGLASASARSLVIQLKDGTKMYYLISLTENPCLTFNDGAMDIQSDYFTVSEVEKFYISETDKPNQLQNPEHESGLRSTGLATECLYIIMDNSDSNTQPEVRLFSIDGKLLEARYSIKGKELILETSALASGMYILKLGSKSLKFQKR